MQGFPTIVSMLRVRGMLVTASGAYCVHVCWLVGCDMIGVGGVSCVGVCSQCGQWFLTGLSRIGRGIHCGVGGFVVWGDSVRVYPPLCIGCAVGKLSGSMVAGVILVLGLHVGTDGQYLPRVLGSTVLVGCLVRSVRRFLP